jgi:hypothetical protein
VIVPPALADVDVNVGVDLDFDLDVDLDPGRRGGRSP